MRRRVRDGRDFSGADLTEAQLFDLDLRGKEFNDRPPGGVVHHDPVG
jgi:uncharacterized protein YjbI with pentapeptide repeats